MIKLKLHSKLVNYAYEESVIKIPLNHLSEGVNTLDNYFIKKSNNKIDYVINRICDHNGGKLINKKDFALCPLHGWKLNLDTLSYNDSFECKEKIKFKINLEGDLEFKSEKFALKESVDEHFVNDLDDIKITHIGHAGLHISTKDFSIVTDPWLIGPAFTTGWWLNKEAKKKYFDLVNDADLIYISHNHPDHLHPETLSYFNKEKVVITGGFKSKSSEKMLRTLKFDPLVLDFKDIYKVENKNIFISIIKSGDFRDDSGLYLNINGYKIILTVDSNHLNSGILPKDIDLLASSFASGASGFPLSFDNYDELEKSKIIKRNRRADLSTTKQTADLVNPKYYLPYAGYFNENCERDSYIKENNLKNSPNDIINVICNNSNIIGLNPMENDVFVFGNDKKLKSKSSLKSELAYNYNQNYFNKYVNSHKASFKINDEEVLNYFNNCNYNDDLELYLNLTDDDFNSLGHSYLINFQTGIFQIKSIKFLESQYKNPSNLKKLFISVRLEAFANIIINKLPWEDFSIGFQCRIKRQPNLYNSKFWYYFTNVYIGAENYRYDANCGACNLINQSKKYI